MVEIRPYGEADAPALDRLLRAVWGDDGPTGSTRPMGLADWVHLLRTDPPDSAASFVAFAGDVVVAMSLAHADDLLTFTWSGVTASHRHHERDLVVGLALRQAAVAVGRGITAVKGEFDSTDPWDVLLMEALPFAPAPAWLTFQRAR